MCKEPGSAYSWTLPPQVIPVGLELPIFPTIEHSMLFAYPAHWSLIALNACITNHWYSQSFILSQLYFSVIKVIT